MHLCEERILIELELFLECRIQFFEVLEGLGISGLWSDLLFGTGIKAIVHRQVQVPFPGWVALQPGGRFRMEYNFPHMLQYRYAWLFQG